MSYPIGKVVAGDSKQINEANARMADQAIDISRLTDNLNPYSPFETTLASSASAEGPGTFEGRKRAALTFGPSAESGWWITRTDLQEQLPIHVSIRNVWTSARNIVLRSGNPHNYLRMVEHIVALRLGLGLDNAALEIGGGDPPLFDRSSLDLVEAIESAKIVETTKRARYVTVKEPVTIGGDRGDFITILPAEKGDHRLRLDTAIHFNSIIGQQRIVYDVTPENFIYGAGARTNATHKQLILAKTVGKLFADMRHMGYTNDNILIHGKQAYVNTPRAEFDHPTKVSLEPVWHRATLDLLAAIALVDMGRFAGTFVSYRAGHTLDVRLMTLLYREGLLEFMD